MPFYSGMCIVCRDEAPADCKSNLERKSYGSKNFAPDPNVSLHIGGENNFIGDTQPLPYASLHTGDGSNFTKEPLPDTAFHVGGENSFTRDTISQPLPYAALHIDDENRLTRDTQPLPNAILNLGGENNFTRDTIIQPLHSAAWHVGGENSFIRDTIAQPLPNATLHIGGENNFTRDATEPLHNATLHIGGENNFTFIGGENNFIGGAQPPANADNEGDGMNSTRDEGIERTFTRKTQPQKNSTRDEGGERIFTRKTQPQNADKEPLLPSAGKSVSSQKKRHQTKNPATLKEPKKARNYNGGMSVALKHMAVAVTSLTNKTKKEDNFSVSNVMKVLQAIPDLDDDLILDACDLLEDEKRARLFLALDANLRKKWLLRKLRS